jgi:hypothetical protein
MDLWLTYWLSASTAEQTTQIGQNHLKHYLPGKPLIENGNPIAHKVRSYTKMTADTEVKQTAIVLWYTHKCVGRYCHDILIFEKWFLLHLLCIFFSPSFPNETI